MLSKSRAPVSQVTAQNTATLLTATRNWHALLGPFSGDELLCFVQLGQIYITLMQQMYNDVYRIIEMYHDVT